MKKYIYIITLAISMVSCVLSDPLIEPEPVEEGLPVTLNLDFVSMSTDRQSIETKGGDNHDINDLYIFIFSSDNGKPGVLKSKLYTSDLDKENANVSNDKGTDNASVSTKVKTKIQTTTGESFIFAFANITAISAPSEYDVSNLKDELDALEIGTECYEELANVSIPLNSVGMTSLQRVTDTYLMAGMFQKTGEYTRANTPCVIDNTGSLSGGTIRMYRLDAQIDFKIISDANSKGTFIPTAWRLYNVPVRSRLMTTAYGSGEDIDGRSPIYTTDAGVAENYWNSEDLKVDAEGSEYMFSFYMFENRKAPTAAGQALDTWGYRHREIMNPLANTDGTVSTEGNKHSFAYAPKYATFVEIDGYFSGTTEYPFGSGIKDGNQHNITATTQYRIHLGDFGSNVNGHTFDDFNTLRNYHYTYTITVKGVEQIIVEVNKDGERLEDMETPGINGIVSYIPENSHRVDSHFETRTIRVRRSDLDDWDEEDFRYLAQTCYGNYEGAKGTDNPRHDIYWVEFILTHKLGKDGVWWSWYDGKSAGRGTSVPTAGRTENHPAYMSYQHARYWSGISNDVRLMYVNDFLNDLWTWKNAPLNDNDHVHSNIVEKVFTVFIKENYYSSEDIDKFDRQRNNSGTSDSEHWKDFCNQPERVMYIGMNKIESAETESRTMENVCVASQRSIQTVYNTDHRHRGLTSAWGIETVDELRGTVEGFDVSGYQTRTPKDGSDAPDFSGLTIEDTDNIYYKKDNGYIPQYDFLWTGKRIHTVNDTEETKWSRYVSQTTHDDMSGSNYYHSYFECLARNRDVNGNGFIDPGEIRWYLPALNQLGDIFIGERGIEPEATLFYAQTQWNHEYQYLTTTLFANDGNQFKMLSEEGFAYNSSETHVGSQKFYNVRCVRNLGVNGDNNYSEGYYDKENISNSRTSLISNYKAPQQYVQVDYANRTMDLTYLNDDSKRGFVNTELTAEHSEHSDENQLYDKFQWADGGAWSSQTGTEAEAGAAASPGNDTFGGDEIAYGERYEPSMRTLTRASLYPNDKKGVQQPASDSPQLGWRAPNMKELMLLHFHVDGFRQNTTHTCTNKDGGQNHEGFDGKYWYSCRTSYSFGGVRANRDWRNWASEWLTDSFSNIYLDYASDSKVKNSGEWFRFDITNEAPTNVSGKNYKLYSDYRYNYTILQGGTGFGLMFLHYNLQGNGSSQYCHLVPVRDIR